MNESKLSDAALAELLTLTVTVNRQGTTMYRNSAGLWHRIHGPAVIWADDSKFWYRNGERHRTDGPAIEWASGRKFWYLYDEIITEREFNERTQSL